MIKRTLTTRIVPLAYLLVFQGVLWGGAFLLELPGAKNTILYKNDSLIGTHWWGIIMLVSSIICYIGLLNLHQNAIYVGAAGLFTCWLFAAIVYGMGGFLFLGIIALTNMLMYGYIALGSALGLLTHHDH